MFFIGYFGCLGFAMNYLKRYTNRRKDELGGWPYAYMYNELRFQFLTIAKFVDVCVGVMVWIALSGLSWRGMAGALRVFTGFTIVTMVATDIWMPVLFGAVYWLLGKKQELIEEEIVEQSDDSELDELAVREQEKDRDRSRSRNNRAIGRNNDAISVESKKSKRRANAYLQHKNKRISKYMQHQESDEDDSSSADEAMEADDDDDDDDDEIEAEYIEGSDDEDDDNDIDFLEKHRRQYGMSKSVSSSAIKVESSNDKEDIEANWIPRVTLPTTVTTSVHQFSSRELVGMASPANHSGSDADRDSNGGGAFETPKKIYFRSKLASLLEETSLVKDPASNDDQGIVIPMNIDWEDEEEASAGTLNSSVVTQRSRYILRQFFHYTI